jgi:VWFA-related protein
MVGTRKTTRFVVLTVVLFFAMFAIQFVAHGQSNQEPLKYEVSVNVIVVPIFAVDGNGQPVYDLKEEELQLFVNDSPTKIAFFRRYQFENEEEVSEEVKKEGDEQMPRKPSHVYAGAGERVKFIIMDSMFNSSRGFRRSKEIAINLVKEREPGDSFVIIENNAQKGVKYIAGPEEDPDVLIKALKGMKTPIETWSKELYASRKMMDNVGFDSMVDARAEADTFQNVQKHTMDAEKMRYQSDIKRFTNAMSQFKYALKTINKPKVVFLISEGIYRGAFKKDILNDPNSLGEINTSHSDNSGLEGKAKQFASLFKQDAPTVFDNKNVFSTFLLNYLKEIVRAVNYGGSVLYTINPQLISDSMDDDRMGDMSMMFLADESGGKYFAGSKPVEIVKRIKRTTAAYYEMVFSAKSVEGDQMKLVVDCKRDGVKVHTLNHAEKEKPYFTMDKVQKKIFALNVVTGGDWSRMVGKVVRVKYKKVKKQKKGKTVVRTIDVTIPPKMRGKMADLYVVLTEPKTHETRINTMSKVLEDKFTFMIRDKKEQRKFYVIIEPTNTYCIYNEIR